MSERIKSLARQLAEASTRELDLKALYNESLEKRYSIDKELTSVLLVAGVTQPVAIALDSNKSLVCVYDGEYDYTFSVVRAFS